MFLAVLTPRLVPDKKQRRSPDSAPPSVRLVSHLGMPAGGVTMKMAVVRIPAANSKKE